MGCSTFSEDFKNMLTGEMKGICDVTLSYKRYWKTVVGNLKDIYGSYADPKRNLEVYKQSGEYTTACRSVKKIRSIPLISFEDIKAMIDEDKAYDIKAAEVLKLKKQLNNLPPESCRDTVIKMASILGLMPDNNRGLFSHLVNTKYMTDQEKAEFKRIIDSKINVMSIIVDVLSDVFLDGFLYEYDCVGAVMTQPHRKHFYRGESAFFGSSKPGLYRNKNTQCTLEEGMINKLRLDQCCSAFDSFDVVTKWRDNSVNYVALAQHYGLKTMMIDITSDLRTALFFACCKIGNDGKWHPLSEEDFAHRNSRKKSLGLPEVGNSKYGILYRSITEITDLKWMIDESEVETIVPVGYQPFMRCAAQSAYMLLAKDEKYDMYTDNIFEKFRFRLSKEICDWIYEEMNCGDKIYPYKDIPEIYQEVSAINKSKKFSENTLSMAVDDLKKSGFDDKYISEIKRIINSWGVEFSDDYVVFDSEKIKEVNESYTIDVAEKIMNKHNIMRPLLYLPADTPVTINKDGECFLGKNESINCPDNT